MNMTEKLPASPEKATTENRNIVSKTNGKHNQQEINDNDIRRRFGMITTIGLFDMRLIVLTMYCESHFVIICILMKIHFCTLCICIL